MLANISDIASARELAKFRQPDRVPHAQVGRNAAEDDDDVKARRTHVDRKHRRNPLIQ